MLRLNVADMSDLELTEHIKVLTEERDKRERMHKENAWLNFRDELMDYLKEYGSIIVRDDAYDAYTSFALTANNIDCGEIGKIVLSEE